MQLVSFLKHQSVSIIRKDSRKDVSSYLSVCSHDSKVKVQVWAHGALVNPEEVLNTILIVSTTSAVGVSLLVEAFLWLLQAYISIFCKTLASCHLRQPLRLHVNSLVYDTLCETYCNNVVSVLQAIMFSHVYTLAFTLLLEAILYAAMACTLQCIVYSNHIWQ